MLKNLIEDIASVFFYYLITSNLRPMVCLSSCCFIYPNWALGYFTLALFLDYLVLLGVFSEDDLLSFNCSMYQFEMC